MKSSMRITFDTNTLDKVARPERFPKDPRQAEFIKIHDALAAGKLKGYFSDTIVTLEGIEKKDRGSVFGSTRTKSQMTQKFDDTTGQETIEIKMTPEQARKPLHPEHFKRIEAALKIGMRALKVPRIGGFRVSDPDFYEADSSEEALSERLNKTFDAGRAIEARGVGYALVKSIA